MLTDYDPIAGRYQQAKLQPWREHVERFTLLALIGDLQNKSVIDLACGEGYYTRLLRHAGARSVLGVDLSACMIDLASKQERTSPLGIEYRVGDVKALEPTASHDLAVAAYLLNYARDRQELAAMCRGVAGALTPGGRFITVNQNPDLDVAAIPNYRDYLFEVERVGEVAEGVPIRWTFHLDDGPLSIENYHLDREIHEEALRAAGFRQVRWHAPRLAPAGQQQADYWRLLLDQSPLAFIECIK